MSKILIHSNAAWVPTGYGQQALLAVVALQRLGHEVAISGFSGLSGTVMEWHKIIHFPNGQEAFGWDVLPGHAQVFGADLVLVLADFWVMSPQALRQVPCPVAAWVPIDTDELGLADRVSLKQTGVRPIAMSRHGLGALQRAGFDDALYVPHSYTAAAFNPWTDRAEARREFGVADSEFAVGIAAANKDTMRKAYPEQFLAFKQFHDKHPNSRLYVHAMIQGKGGWDLEMLRDAVGLPEEAVVFSAQYEMITGLVAAQDLGRWHRSHDVTLHCSMGEGFGLTAIESQACGTPIITTKASAMTELCAPSSWLVAGEPVLNPVHYRYWVKPDVGQIVRALEKAHSAWKTEAYGKRRDECAAFARSYEQRKVADGHWEPALEELLPGEGKETAA